MKRFYPLVTLLTLIAFTCGCDQDLASTQANTVPDGALPLDQGQGTGDSSSAPGQSRAPDDGPLISFGGGKQLEFRVDRNRRQATIFVVSDDGKTTQPIRTGKIFLLINEPQKEVELKALPLEGELLALPPEGERDGGSSRFVGTDEVFGHPSKFAGTISAMVDGTSYTGYFKDQPYYHN